MENFMAQYWLDVFFALITAGALGICRYAFSQMKNYKKLLEEQDQGQISKIVKKELQPIKESVNLVDKKIDLLERTHKSQLEALVDSYKFELLQQCKRYLDQGYLTTAQFDRLSEVHKLYNRLGGNDQGDEYYEKAKRLPVRDEEEN